MSVIIINLIFEGAVILLENLRFHIEEEGKGVDKDGKKVKKKSNTNNVLCISPLRKTCNLQI